ncbi:MAG: ChaN family lipoprotein [Myxococcota bacterium]
MLHRLWVYAVLVAIGCIGCATSSSGVRPEPPGTLLEPGIYRVATGEPITEEVLLSELANVAVVYIGESHDVEAHHVVQARVLVGLVERDPQGLALGMEMFQRPYQEALDRFVRSELDEAGMLVATEYAQRWGFDFAFYRPMMALMRDVQRPILALNAPAELTRKVSRQGLEALSDVERAQLPPTLSVDNPEHRAQFEAVMNSVHAGMDPATMDRFYTAQAIWDATMAQTVVEGLKRSDVDQVVVLAGLFHVERGLGIPFHVQATQPDIRGAIIIPTQQTAAHPVVAEELFGSGVGDFVWVVSGS